MSKLASYHVIKTPVMTEKAFMLIQQDKYTFVVNGDCSKLELSTAFEELFPDRKVLSVRTIRIPSKKKRVGRKPMFRKPYTKAIFHIEGEPIEMIPGV